jgi:hypothetical protein
LVTLEHRVSYCIHFSNGGSDFFFKRMKPWALIRYLKKNIVEILFETKYLKQILVTIKKNWPSIPATRIAPSVALYKLSTLDS